MVHTVSAGGSDCRYLGRFGLVISQSRCAKTKRAASRAEAALWNTQAERTSRSGRERNSGPEERRPDLQGNEVSSHWTVSRRAIIDRVRHTRRSNHLLFWRDRGGRLEIHGWRHDLDFGLR